MRAGYHGAYVIAWPQVCVEYDAGGGGEIVEGLTFRWSGVALRMDAPPMLLSLGDVAAPRGGQPDGRHRQRHNRAPARPGHEAHAPEGDLPRNGFIVSDGAARYTLVLVEAAAPHGPLLLCEEGVPPADRLLRVVRAGARRAGGVLHRHTGLAGRLTGIAADTVIDTPGGPRPAGHLRPGDRVILADGGTAALSWVGLRQVSGGRLTALAELRPWRVPAGTLGPGTPTRDLLLAPDHRVLLRGPAACRLHGPAGGLAAARDLGGCPGVEPLTGLRSVLYVHLQTDRAGLLRAAGAGVERVDPDGASDETLPPGLRADLAELPPPAEPHAAGGPRVLEPWQAALALHDAAPTIDTRVPGRISAAVGA